MRRFFFAAVALVSLLLFICVLLAWRGSWIQDKEMPRGYVGGWNYWGYDGFHEPYYVSVSQRGWFMLYRESSREVKRLFSIPYWSAAVVTAIIPAIWFRSLALRHKSKRRAWQGRCQSCGYSLTGITRDRCPECGTPVRKSAGASA